MRKLDYPFTIHPLPAEEGGGYLIEFPDLPGCISDGDTPEEALANGRDALQSYLLTAKEFGDPVPTPGISASGQWRQRAPRSLHTRLAAQARREGVSLNTLALSMLAEGLGRRAHKAPASRPASRK